MKYIKIENETAIIKIKGRFDLVHTHELDVEIEDAFISGCSRFVLDLSETTYIDSSAIRTINSVFHRVGRDNFETRNVTSDEVALELYSSEVDEEWNVTPPLDHERLEKQMY